MQLAFETVSPDANRLSFTERSNRMSASGSPMSAITNRRRVAMPHVDDLLFAVALAGLLALGAAELRDGLDYATSTRYADAATSPVAPGLSARSTA
jgi:hypothetical protein